MFALIFVLLVIWVVCIIIGFAVKTLLWLAILGLAAFVITGAAGAVHHFLNKNP
jgi:uncharacterized membrane protein YeiH